ncbi:MAG: GNAT family N-acetyltransferase [Oscillospiraceae bacterium]|nr:GNAT family N-acetyltransferase [Oscillospiraceae bacterium]
MDLTGIDYLGLDRVLRRGTGEIVEQSEKMLFIRDSVSGAYMLACEDAAEGRAVLARHVDEKTDLLMVSDLSLGREALQRYGFAGSIECFQAAYYGLVPETGSSLQVRTADENDLDLLVRSYDHLSPEELALIVKRRKLLLGYVSGELVGFVGEHLEGSLGLLHVFPPYRRRGYGEALEKIMIAETMREGFVPFGQIVKDNAASLLLQRKLGMTISDRLSVWMWRPA